MALVRDQIKEAIKENRLYEGRDVIGDSYVYDKKEERYFNHREEDLYYSIKEEMEERSMSLEEVVNAPDFKKKTEMLSIQVLFTDDTAFTEEVRMDGVGQYLQNLYDTEGNLIRTVTVLKRYYTAL